MSELRAPFQDNAWEELYNGKACIAVPATHNGMQDLLFGRGGGGTRTIEAEDQGPRPLPSAREFISKYARYNGEMERIRMEKSNSERRGSGVCHYWRYVCHVYGNPEPGSTNANIR